MRKKIILAVLLVLIVAYALVTSLVRDTLVGSNPLLKKTHWLLLHRKSEKEYLYYGLAGQVNNSVLLKTFQVKTGNPLSSPTPLPQLLGREYWILVSKESSADNPETAPYFLQLNIPAPSISPYGPEPYTECTDEITRESIQCNWELPGYFGLHGVNTNSDKLLKEDMGSSGCIRHSDDDITYLYNVLNPDDEEIRYYIEDI